MLGLLTLHLGIPGCASLKEKRGRLKPLLARLHRQFNVSAAEMGLQDKWQEAVIACGMVNSDKAHIQRSLQVVIGWVEKNWPDVQVFEEYIELL
ncbi:MAG: DUF503 domain-containing protein [Anaerolineales bacterium]|nr:DUF503 domain-containing protein [Chloroflexota bacterium]MDP2995427.1 DUF503 domain-containing protein [Anaerolineales bacterium]